MEVFDRTQLFLIKRLPCAKINHGKRFICDALKSMVAIVSLEYFWD